MRQLLLCLITFLTLTANAQYTKLFDFNDTNGSYAYGNLVSDSTFLYGMTWMGGTNNLGVIFKIKPDGSGNSKLLDFAGATNGRNPYGSLISDGTFLYGMTQYGGANDSGTIFKIKPDGSAYSKLFDFPGLANGRRPQGSLISDGTFLYGMTSEGGTNKWGTIFKIKTDGTGYSKLLDFNGESNGASPLGSLISDGTFLYGMTYSGGTNHAGVIFKIKPDGSEYSKLIDFSSVNGSYPYGSLIFDGTFLYGMTWGGGAGNAGVIFKVKPDGSGYTILYYYVGATNGWHPEGTLISDGTYLWGMTFFGGTSTYGVIFKIKLDGTGYCKLFDFLGIPNGSNPYGSLIFDGNFFYGMTVGGGVNNKGVIFKVGVASGIAENNLQNDFTIYPNPSTGKINFQIPKQLEQPKTLEVFDCVGQLQLSKTDNFSEIDISNLASGIYIIKASGANWTINKKMIKE